LPHSLEDYRYTWPDFEPARSDKWHPGGERSLLRDLPESAEELAADSRWPAFFPCPMCLITTAAGERVALEKVVGASIVNRFPYIIALSFCRDPLSERHHARRSFMDLLESGGVAAIQYLPPGSDLDRVMQTIAGTPDDRTEERLAATGLPFRSAETHGAPVFESAYMVYEARMVEPGTDFDGASVYESAWRDIGSHRVYFMEITAIQLRQDVASGRSQIHWRSLPVWEPRDELQGAVSFETDPVRNEHYEKGYTPHYRFPSRDTVAFEWDETKSGMAIKHLPPLPHDQVEVDNDRARWPCFFPSSAGIITSWTPDGRPNVMPCGSTTILSRHPLVITPCISYASINVRYAPRASLDFIRSSGRFGCGVPYVNDAVVAAMKYAGNISQTQDREKAAHAGLAVEPDEWAPVFPALPIHFDCKVTGELRLGTHIMFLGEVVRIRVRRDVTPENPISWVPWADVRPVESN
jgi:flavin reductase (DIM6/NTAB) family NADH-FMN oxidoreductase RutF